MDYKQIEERIEELTAIKNEIFKRIKNKGCTTDDIIYYGKELQNITIRIDELDLLLWQRSDDTK